MDKEGESFFPLVVKHAKELVAIGETGLDYHYSFSTPDNQKKYLRLYLKLALETKLPIIIHCREAFADFFEIIDSRLPGCPGVLHCFTGTLKEAEEVLKRGWYLSLSGIATFKKSTELREVAKITPLDQLLIETDAPHLAPQSKRGLQNEPAYLLETAQMIAAAKGIDVIQLAQSTTANAKSLFDSNGTDHLYRPARRVKSVKKRCMAEAALKFLYGHDSMSKIFGAPLLYLLIPIPSFLRCLWMVAKAAWTQKKIEPFIRDFDVDTSEFEQTQFPLLQRLFHQKIKAENLVQGTRHYPGRRPLLVLPKYRHRHPLYSERAKI